MIEIKDLTVAFGDKSVFDRFHISFPDRGTVALTGESGRGKTTLLRVMAGLIKPKSGEICGLENKKIAVMFQEDRLLPWFTALDNAAAVGDRTEAKALLEELELPEYTKYPDELSGGMRRRVALARALLFHGDILLLDEPFKGMDEALRARVAKKCMNAAPLILFTTHEKDEIALFSAIEKKI